MFDSVLRAGRSVIRMEQEITLPNLCAFPAGVKGLKYESIVQTWSEENGKLDEYIVHCV